MKNIFEVSLESHYQFEWDKLGNIKKGREHLGEEMPVLVYRLLEYSMNDVLFKNFGIEKTDEIFRQAGYLAGCEFAKNALPLDADESTFVSTLAQTLETLKVGILRMEEADFEKGEFVCKYDEGFFAGILEAYTKKPFKVREVDCWSSGSRVCRFKGTVDDDR